MNMHNMLLGIAILWPLLLAIPKIHSNLPWSAHLSRHLAILPAAVLIFLPGNALLQLPWLFFTTGLSLNTDIRWVLAMSVILWLSAASLFKTNKSTPQTQQTSFFLMTLSGNLGVIFASDLVTFFIFATLMSYSFYALIVEKHDAASRHAGHWYLIFLVLADLALFEAMLLAASINGNLSYELVRENMTGTYSSFYLWMVLLGFTLKAGIWPFYFWVSASYQSSSQMTKVLLGAVPVTMGLLGLLRWVPLGEQVFYTHGIVIQLLGAMAVLHATWKIYNHGFGGMLTTCLAIAASGIFCIALGAVLVEPTLWQTYKNLGFPFIAILGITLAILSIITEKFFSQHKTLTPAPHDIQTIFQAWINKSGINKARKNKLSATVQHTTGALQNYQSILLAAYLSIIEQYRNHSANHKLIFLLSGWKAKITLFVLLGLAFALLAR